jgi:hypothetical protein
MTYVGADVESLRSAAAQLRSVADELDGHNQALTSLLGGIDWVGDVATRFLSSWTGGHRINLSSTSQFFREAAETLERNAGEQQQASGTLAADASVATRFSALFGDEVDLVARAGKGHEWVEGADAALSVGLVGLAFLRRGPLSKLLVAADDWAALRLLAARGKIGALHLFGRTASPALAGQLGGLTSRLNALNGGSPFESFKSAKGGAALTAVAGGMSFYLAHREHGGSDAETYEAGVDAALATGASFVPGGAIVYTASSEATKYLYGCLDERLDIIDSGVDNYVRSAYGTDTANLTPSQAAELTRRYSGLGGLFRSNYDVAVSNAQRLAGLVGL